MLIVAIANQKGGVGKTSVTLGLAGSLAAAGHRPLVIDLDPQANSTAALDPADPVWTTSDLLRPDPETGEVISGSLAQAIVTGSAAWPGVSLVAAELSLASREQDQTVGREFRLRTVLEGVGRHDVALIDCPPSLGQLSLNAFTAADAVLLVTEPAAASLAGLAAVVDTVEQVRKYYNPGLRLAGVVVNRYRSGRIEPESRMVELVEAFGDQLWTPLIPDREIVNRAYGAASPVSAFGTAGREVADVYDVLAVRLLATTEAEARA